MSRKVLFSLVLGSAMVAGCSDNGMFGSKDKSDVSLKNQHQIAQADMPAAVLSSFHADHPNATIDKVAQQKFSNGANGYRITYTTSDGRRETAEYNAQGQRP
jgi:hypothetical protein